MSSDPIRAALERLINLDDAHECDRTWEPWSNAITAARAALAEDSDVDDVLKLAAIIRKVDGNHSLGAAALAEAILAHWGRPAAPPAPLEGEVGEQPGSPEGEARALARAIDEVAKSWHPQACLLGNVTAKQFRRAAALLRQHWLLLGRQHRLQEENHRFREPERTILCDILANGTLLPDPDGTRYGIPAAPPAPLVDLPPDYIDEWITNPRDRSLLEVFHKACNSEGGSADEVILRGLKAVLHAFADQVVPVVYALTNDELLKLADDSDMDRLEGERGYPDGTVIKEGCWEAWDHQLLAFARNVAELAALRAAVVPVPVSKALIKAECALADVAEGERWCDEGDLLQWAERRCAKALASIRPVMKQHQIRTSEWPPLPAPQGGEVGK